MKKIILVVIVLSFIFSFSEGGFQYLYIDNDPLTKGAGEAGGVLSSNVYKNPSVGGFIENPFIVLIHTEYLFNTRFEEFRYFFRSSFGTIGVGLRGLYTDEMIKTDSEMTSVDEKFRYIASSFLVHYSKELVKYFSMGLNLKPFYTSADTFVSMGAFSDIGISYTFEKGFAFGFSLNNFGTGVKYISESSYPISVKSSFGYDFNKKAKIITDITLYPYDNNLFEVGGGFEKGITDWLSLRAGYLFNSRNENWQNIFNFGFSVSFSQMHIDYSPSYNIDLGLMHTFGIRIDLKSAVKDIRVNKEVEMKMAEKEKIMSEMFLSKAKEYLARKMYDEALDNVDLSLIWMPENIIAGEIRSMIEQGKKENDLNEKIDKGLEYYMTNDFVNASAIFKNVLDEFPANEKAMKYYNLSEEKNKISLSKSKSQNKFEEGMSFYTKQNYLSALKIFEEIYNTDKDENAKEYIDKTNTKINEIIEKNISSMGVDYTTGKYSSVIKRGEKILVYKRREADIKNLMDNASKKLKEKVEDLFKKGVEQFNSKKYKEAESFFEQIIVLDSTNKEANDYIQKIKSMKVYSKVDVSDIYLKGIEAYTNNDFKLAIKYWEKCLELNSTHINAKKNIEKAKKKIEELENR